MCGVQGVANAAIGATAAGGLLGAYGQLQQGAAARKQGDYQSQVLQNAADLVDLEGQDLLYAEAEQARGLRRTAAGDLARGRTGFAGGNVALSSGSALAFEEDVGARLEEDLATTRVNRRRAQYAKQLEAADLRRQAGLVKSAGRAQYRAGVVGAGASLLGTAGTVAGQYYSWNR